MAKAIWSGVIGFGMVSIPVKLYTATGSKTISFHLLHDNCKTRIKEVRWCPHCDQEVPYEHVVRGYEYSKGNFVIIADEDLEKLPLPSKSIINVTSFVAEHEIDPVFISSSYYLEPDKTAQRPFALLLEALEKKKMVGIATLALRNKERLCAVRCVGATMLIEMLFYPDEIRVDLSNPAPKIKASKQELHMAETLIELMTSEFKPDEYQDHYREALSEVIQSKLEGEEIVSAPLPGSTKVVDLMEALRASVDRVRSGNKGKKTKDLELAAAPPSRKSGSRALTRRAATRRSSAGTAARRATSGGAAMRRKPKSKKRGAA